MQGFLHKKHGFTLIEVVLSLCILAIIALAFLPAFTAAFKWITKAGNKSDISYQSQLESEDKIVEGATTVTPTNMVIKVGGIPIVNMEGEDVTKGSMRFFIPK